MIIMISASNSDVCLSMARIIKSSDVYKGARLIGLSPDTPWPARAYFDDVIAIPFANESAYGDSLSNIISKEKPNIFIPFSESELFWFATNSDQVAQLPTKVIINPPDVLNNFLDKSKTSYFLKNAGLDVPVTLNLDDVTARDLPVLIKPRRSAGSKNMTIVRNLSQLEGFRQEHSLNLEKYIAQELIDSPDAEFTCGVWRAENALRHCTFRRKLQGGMTGFARVESHNAIDLNVKKIAAVIKGDFFINVQLRLRGGYPYIFEINPRFSSTVMMRHKIGFQDFLWTLNHATGQPIAPFLPPRDGIEIFRTPEEIIVESQEYAA